MSRKPPKYSEQPTENMAENIIDMPPIDSNTLKQTVDESVNESVNESIDDLGAEKINGDGNNQSPANEAPTDIDDEDLSEKLKTAQSQIDQLKEDYIRAKAEMENVRRRSQNEMISARKYAIEGFAQELLSVVDSLERAAMVEMDAPNGEADMIKENMKKGLELTLKQFDTVMEKFGVVAVQAAPGVKFDPDVHQAISVIASAEVEPEHIVNVMQKGFSLKDRLLRPAMVVIAKSPE